MTRYFLKEIQIEGFRGINNQGDPLCLRFKPDAVNSVFAPNAQGKSSIFEALCYAIKGSIPKFANLQASEKADEYYCNRFHSSRTAVIVLILTPNDGSNDVTIKVQRQHSGTRQISSPSGHPEPEKLLRSLDNEISFIDHKTSLQFVEGSPLHRGRTFSALLGIGQFSELRQVLETLANSGTVNRDFKIETLESETKILKNTADIELRRIANSFEKITSNKFSESSDLGFIIESSTKALQNVTLLQPHFDDHDIISVDFTKLRSLIKETEQSEKQERLVEVIKSIGLLDTLVERPEEAEEQTKVVQLISEREEAFKATRGPLFKSMYESVQAVLVSEYWDDPKKCPACTSTLENPLNAWISEQLNQYKKIETLSSTISDLWKSNSWIIRLRKLLETNELKVGENLKEQFVQLDTTFRAGKGTLNDFYNSLSLLTELEQRRFSTLKILESERDNLRVNLPPSLVSLTEQVSYAEQLKDAISNYRKTSAKISEAERKLANRQRWRKFIEYARDTFAGAEVKLSTDKTLSLEKQYQEMYSDITNNPNITPKLVKSPDSEELNLRLENFYGLKNLSATTLLAESYRNALAISIFMSAALNNVSAINFIVLDDITSSFDAGHQFALMELIRTKIARLENPNGIQIIMFSHDGLLEKYFDRLSVNSSWHHQRIQGLPPKGAILTQAQDANRLRTRSEDFLRAGQVNQAEPLIRQYLEFRLLEIIRKVDIRVPIDFSIRDDRKMVQNCLDVISAELNLRQKAGSLVLEPAQINGLASTHFPALITNWVSHYATGVTSSFDPYVLLGVLDAIDQVAECFKYDCYCSGARTRRYYKSLSKKHCTC